MKVGAFLGMARARHGYGHSTGTARVWHGHGHRPEQAAELGEMLKGRAEPLHCPQHHPHALLVLFSRQIEFTAEQIEGKSGLHLALRWH